MSKGYSYSIETVNIGQQAEEVIDACRANGVDPLKVARSYRDIAAAIEYIIHKENQEGKSDD